MCASPFVQPLLPACSTEAMLGGSLTVFPPREGKPYTNGGRAKSKKEPEFLITSRMVQLLLPCTLSLQISHGM